MTLETIHKKLSKYSKNALIKVVFEENFQNLNLILRRLQDIEFDEMVAARDGAWDKWMDKKLTLIKYKFGSKEYLETAKEIYSLERKIDSLCNKISAYLNPKQNNNGEDKDDYE